MNMQHIIEQCAQKGISITLEESGIGLTGDKQNMTHDLLDLIRSNKAELTEYIKSFNNASSGNNTGAIQVVDKSGVLPLSPTQQNIWLANKITGASAEFNMPGACEIKGPFYFDAAKRALNEIVRRHEVLRTCYLDTDDGPVQMVQQTFELNIKHHDLTGLGDDVRQDALIELLKEDINQPFDLELDLMLRASYVELARGEQQLGVLLFNTHHIAFDGWSMEVLHREFFVLYHAYISGQPSPLSDLRIQYADYASWQLDRLDAEDVKQQLNYWQQMLNDLPHCHSLPLSFDRPQFKQQEAAVVQRTLSAETAIGLKKLANLYQLTPFMLLHGALSLVIARHSGCQDIVIGTPFANRQQAELEPLIGFFVNTLVLRSHTQHDSIGEYFEHIKQVHIGAQSNQDVPFTKLVDLLKVPRDSAYTPLFQIMLTTENDFGVNQEPASMELAGSTLSVMAPDSVAVKSAFDLDVSISLGEQGASVKFLYDIALFSREKVDEINRHLCQLLEVLGSQAETLEPSSSMDMLPMMSDSETTRLANRLNGMWQEFDDTLCVQELIEKQVVADPHQIAVEHGNQQYSYAELNAKANQLAACLVEEYAIQPDVLVGISMARSCDLIVTILAVMKAGGAYLPLDPDYPQERLNDMVADAGLKLIISDPHLVPRLQFSNCQTLAFNACNLAAYSDANLDCAQTGLSANDLAYVIYTSGSTGKPKGVMIEHKNLHHFLLNTRERYRLDRRDKVLQFSTMNFDIFVEEMFATLSSGATLVLRNEDCMSGRDAFSQFCQQHGVTVVSLPTAFWHQVNAGAEKLFFDGLRLVILGGEALQVESVNAYFDQVQGVELINSYGPTEATVTATSFHLTEHPENNRVPIGGANVNTSLLILDGQHKVVPEGAIGELYIGGAGLARGYLNQPVLSAQRFIDNPYYNPAQPQSSKRLYKTGDLVSCNQAGDLEFHGRADDQVKIRGFRIELGEVESRIAALQQVEMALVLAVEPEQGIKQLVAYVQPDERAVTKEEFVQTLKDQLAAQLPEYMVPSSFVVIDEWPMTPNGKVDKKALAAIQNETQQSSCVAPENELEKALLSIWSEVLRVSENELSVEASFFEMGGHSLMAVRLVAMVRERLQQEITVTDIFEAQSVRNMAEKLAGNQQRKGRGAISKVARDSDGMPLSFSQQRLWFIDQLRGGSSEYNMPAALEVTGKLDDNAVSQAFAQIVKRHEVLRTVYKDTGNGVLQHILDHAEFRLDRIDLSHLSGEAQSRRLQALVEQDAQKPFDLSRDLMLRACSILLSEQRADTPRKSVLLFNMHHIASDGWSMEILSKEFIAH